MAQRTFLVTVKYKSLSGSINSSTFNLTTHPDLGLLDVLGQCIGKYVKECDEIFSMTVVTQNTEQLILEVRNVIKILRNKLVENLYNLILASYNEPISNVWVRVKDFLLIHESRIMKIFRDNDTKNMLPIGLLFNVPDILHSTIMSLELQVRDHGTTQLFNDVEQCMLEHDEMFLDYFCSQITITVEK